MMRISKKVSRAAVVSAIALSALAMGSAVAFATGSFNVTAGSAPAGTVVPYTATTTGASPQVTFKDTTGGTTLNCSSASAKGTVTVGSGRDSLKLGTIDGATTGWNTCTGPFGLVLTVTGINTWYIDATGSTVSGVTPGRVSSVTAHVAGGCNFDVTGTVAGTYTNGTSSGTLTLPGTTSGLTISNVSGSSCSLVNIANGHAASFKATYGVTANTSSYNPISINGTI